ncbi:MAG: hypothetical protein M3O71_21600 [Bacteroidota bacterium]|nr:hypothetical protein [Bacteroidota bacterium]
MLIIKDGVYTNDQGVKVSLVDPNNREKGYMVWLDNGHIAKSELDYAHSIQSSLGEISIDDTNIFNTMPINLVKRYFMQLHTSLINKDTTPFLSNYDVVNFIKRAFNGDTSILPIEINVKHGRNKLLVDFFHNYFSICRDRYEGSLQQQKIDKYQKLLFNNFVKPNNDSIDKSNFRSYYSPDDKPYLISTLKKLIGED